MDAEASTAEATEPTVATVQEASMKLLKTIYNCYQCIHKWAVKSKAPDPKLKIKRFTNIEDYVNHLDTIHGWTDRDIIKGKCGIAFLDQNSGPLEGA